MSDDRRVLPEIDGPDGMGPSAGTRASDTVGRPTPSGPLGLLMRFWTPFYLLLALALGLRSVDFRHSYGLTVPHLLSGPIYIAFVVVSLGLLLAPGKQGEPRPWTGWWALDVSLTTFLISQGFKATVRLPRPSGSHSGFPSGHTLYSFALAWLVARKYPRLALVWYPMAAAVGWSRVATHEHYAYQVYWGAVFGLLAGWAVGRMSDGVFLPRYIRGKIRKGTRP